MIQLTKLEVRAFLKAMDWGVYKLDCKATPKMNGEPQKRPIRWFLQGKAEFATPELSAAIRVVMGQMNYQPLTK